MPNTSKQVQNPRYVLNKPFFIIATIVVTLAALIQILPRLSLAGRHFIQFPIPLVATVKMSTYGRELKIAELAIQRAALLTKAVFHEKVKGTLSKDDNSPVTLGDFGAQALIISAIKHNFPQDEIVGEEDSTSLVQDLGLRDQVWSLVKNTKLEDPEADAVLGGPINTASAMVDAIDSGNSSGGRQGRIWALDPIDGTKGFLRGGQYALCLALMVDGDVKVGVLGCPNLPVDDSELLSTDAGVHATDTEGFGVIFAAIKGQGATSRPLGRAGLQTSQPISMRPVSDLKEATFCESVEALHSSHSDHASIAKKLGVTRPSIRMDSQAKYGSIARGAGDIYLRLPTSAAYQEKIWDHAAGYLTVREAGGIVTDIKGNSLDFGKGRTLADNKGIVAAPSAIHAQVLAAVMEVLAEK